MARLSFEIRSPAPVAATNSLWVKALLYGLLLMAGGGMLACFVLGYAG